MIYKIIFVLFMVFIKSIFSAADTAFTYVNNIKISRASRKDKTANKIMYFINNKNKFYGIIEVGITMIELFASAYVAEEFVELLRNFLITFNMQSSFALILSIIITTVFLSYVLLIFGGILPKQIARNHPEKVARKLINIVWIISILNYPFDLLIKFSTKMFSKIFKLSDNPKDKLTEKEIKMMIYEGKDQGVIDKIEKSIALKAVSLNNILVKDIMTPKDNIFFINITNSKEKILSNIQKYRYTRIPVFETNKNNIIGILNIKDFIIEYAYKNKINLNIKSHLRPVYFIDKSQNVSDVLKLMQQDNQSIAIVKNNDEVVGLLSMEDIIEIFVGKIFDEFNN